MIKRRMVHQVTRDGALTMVKLAAIIGGTDAKAGTWKLGNKEWNDDWLAPK